MRERSTIVNHNFEQRTEVEGYITSSLSPRVLAPPPSQSTVFLPNTASSLGEGRVINQLRSLVLLTPTFPSSLCLSVPGARAKNNKILTFFYSLLYSNHERIAGTTADSNAGCRANIAFRPERQTGLRGFLRRQVSGFYSEQSTPFQGSQAANHGQQHGETIDQQPRAIQLEKLSRGGRCLNEMLRANSGAA